jgi:hypothetical protein
MASTMGIGQRAYRDATRTTRIGAAVLGCVILGGCASQSSAPPPPPPPVSTPAPATPTALSPELCAAAAEYQQASNAIVDLNATEVGTEGVKKALQDLETAASNLITAARDQFGPQVAELERAVASLRGTIAGLSDQDSLSTNLGKIAASVSVVEQAAQPIADSVRSGCPSVPSAEMPPPAS